MTYDIVETIESVGEKEPTLGFVQSGVELRFDRGRRWEFVNEVTWLRISDPRRLLGETLGPAAL